MISCRPSFLCATLLAALAVKNGLATDEAAARVSEKTRGFMQPKAEAPQEAAPLRLEPERRLPGSLGALEDLERLVERREKAMERTSWALGILCVVALGSAGFSARRAARTPKVD
eukprot:TRINITY_DN95380_c0_g1_i1.p1 TRINITY_DN95380_c0_g1~~TRINITY_DN95380_c0_g1_i1.p1  ORF type:complete len:115 (-),score=31.67 TRINITY_DN95380_c0_g1_i1:74-418(-)